MMLRRNGMAGQAAAEYALILGGVAVLLIVAFVALRTNLAATLNLAASPTTVEASSPTTPLGSTFSEISNAMIDRILDYYRKHNRWPRSWGDFAFTDLGLDPKYWQNGFNGIIYKPVGNRLAITPDKGYTFIVQDINGNQITLPSSRNWSLLYNMQTGTWHYHNLNGPQLNISTLQVVPPSPRNQGYHLEL